MKVNIQKIKPNPYRSNLGVMSDIQIQRIIESYKMSDFGKGQRFEVRKNGQFYQLVYGHHRLEALKRYFNGQTMVEVIIRDYDDKMMLQELLRENLTQEDRWFSKMKAMVLTKKFLQEQGKPSRNVDVTKFLSRNEETISSAETAIYLSIAENLNHELIKEITFGRRGHEETNRLSIKQAYYLSRFPDYREQKDLFESLKKCYIKDHVSQAKYLGIYRSLPLQEQQLIRSGKVNLSLIANIAKPEEIEQISQLRPQIDKASKILKRNKLATQIFANLMDLYEIIQKNKKVKFTSDESKTLSKLYKKVARELLKQDKILQIERR